MSILPKNVREMAGISYRQLQYWESSGLINLERNGKKRDISVYDLALYICIARLRRQGVSIQQIRKHYVGWITSVLQTIQYHECIYLIPQAKGPHGLMVAGGHVGLTLGHSKLLDMGELSDYLNPPEDDGQIPLDEAEVYDQDAVEGEPQDVV